LLESALDTGDELLSPQLARPRGAQAINAAIDALMNFRQRT
jgi:hypothetical protein